MIPWALIILAMFAGTMVPMQAGVNSQLAKWLGEPLQAAFISFLGGMLGVMVCCLFARTALPHPSRILEAPPLLLIGGLLGVFMVVTTIILAPKLGAAVLISCIVAGQMIASLAFDHYGLLGFQVHAINLWRLVGAGFLVIGVVLIRHY